jgi:hypothetical protein
MLRFKCSFRAYLILEKVEANKSLQPRPLAGRGIVVRGRRAAGRLVRYLPLRGHW